MIIYFSLILLSGTCIHCSANGTGIGDLIITNEKSEDGKKFITTVFNIEADTELVYITLRNVEKFPEFMPGSAEVKILENGSNYQVVKFSGSRGFLSADIVMRRTIDDNNKRIEWKLVEGPLSEVCGYWRVERDNKKKSVAIVHYSNYVDAGALIPGFLVRKYLYEDIKKMVPNIKKRVESGGTWMSDEYLEKTKVSSPPDNP